MDCNVVKDLMPLYIDACCSEESAGIVKAHMENCPGCKALYESLSASDHMPAAPVSAPAKFSKLHAWGASILQSVLLFASFALITAGVALEANVPSGLLNGYFAFVLVVPAAGFLLSLANWYFIRLYRSRRLFSNCSLFATLAMSICGNIWAAVHYGLDFGAMLQCMCFMNFFEILQSFSLYGLGLLLTAVFCVLSKILSNQYAKMLGKE